MCVAAIVAALGSVASAVEIDVVVPDDGTQTVELQAGQSLGNVALGQRGKLTVLGNVEDIPVTNLTLESGSMIRSNLSGPGGTRESTVTVGGKLNAGNGHSAMGDLDGGDWYFTNLMLAGTSTFNWTFASATKTNLGAGNEIAVDDRVTVFGAVNLGDGVTIQLVDGDADATADGVDVALFWAIGGLKIDGVRASNWGPVDLAKVTVLAPPDCPGWTWDTDASGNPILEYVFDEWVVLKGLVVPEPATLSFLALGGLAVLRRRKRGACK